MSIHTEDTILEGLRVVVPRVFKDSRGFFMETYSKPVYTDAGIREEFVQDNVSFSGKGVVRGLHFQNPNAQGKLVHVLQGKVFDVAVDIRKDSPDFGRWHGEYLSSENCRQLWIPAGFAHGFCVVSDSALLAYKCTDLYTPENEGAIRWDDPDIGIEWPAKDPVISEKDAAAPFLSDIPPERFTF
jgi:dTDP-4-dehydrorhamnose 3,5-epimerase